MMPDSYDDVNVDVNCYVDGPDDDDDASSEDTGEDDE